MAIVGCIIGFFLPIVMVPTKPENQVQQGSEKVIGQIRHEVFVMLLVVAIIQTALVVALYFFFEAKALTPA